MSEPMIWSGEWVRTRTDDQLRELMDGASSGSPAYDAVSREIARREAQQDRAQEMRWIKATFAATVILGLAAIAATFAAR